MRITFIQGTVDMSGGVKVVAIYSKALAQMGHDVRVISTPARSLPLASKLRSWFDGLGWPSDQVRQPSHYDGSGIDHHILDRWRPVTDNDVWDGDVVIATWWETAEWVNLLGRKKGAKAYFVQGHEIFPYLPVERCRATYSLPLHKIVVAQWLKNLMNLQYGDRIVDVVPNSVDRSQFFAPARGKQSYPTVGFLYSTAPCKGLDVTLAAIRILRERIRDLRVVTFGSQHPTDHLPLPKSTEFHLAPPQHRIRDLYSKCDAWMTCSRSEGFNLPALEAMACRTPVVATRTGWPEESVKTGRNGVLVDVDDVSAVADGVEWLLSRTDAEWQAVSSAAYTTSSTGSWQESAQMFERALKHACERAAQGKLAGT